MFDKMNGWQRLWLCATGAALLICGVIWPWLEVTSSRNSPAHWDSQFTLRKEVNSGRCSEYINKPFNELKEPPYSAEGDTCYYIYSERKFSEKHEPYNEKSYAEAYDAETRGQAFGLVLVCLVGVMLASSLVYFLGWLTAWIRRGFSVGKP